MQLIQKTVIITSINVTLAKARPCDFHIVIYRESKKTGKKHLEQILNLQKEQINIEELTTEKMEWQERDSIPCRIRKLRQNKCH